MRLLVGEGLLQEAFAQFRACGAGHNECVVYWTGPLDDRHRVDSVVHPIHAASPIHYEVDRAWAVQFAIALAAEQQAVRVQVHVHPADAFHSNTDDQFAMVSTPGFLSLVVPDCAQGPVNLDRCHLAELMADGSWRGVPPTSRIELQE